MSPNFFDCFSNTQERRWKVITEEKTFFNLDYES
jgi:hypothetical protein